MVFDITKRQARDKTFDNIKDVLHLKVARLDTSRSMSPSARIGSPEGETIQRKQKAIEMMQGARR